MKTEIPILCSLNDYELRDRREEYLQRMSGSIREVAELENGFCYTFLAEGNVLADLAAIIRLERECCPFLNFELNVPAGSDYVTLKLTGQDGTKDAVSSLFNWNN